MTWNDDVVAARVECRERRVRYEAGSPNREEIEAYRATLEPCPRGSILVLGMTPELRAMAAREFARVVSVDASRAAIDAYGPWVSAAHETIVASDWSAHLTATTEVFDAVVGDGIFGNLAGPDAAASLLRLVHSRLRPDGVFTTRMAVVPDDVASGRWALDTLLRQFREGTLDEPSLGLTARLLGLYPRHYDATSGMLDSGGVFDALDRRHADGDLSDLELAICRRYVFRGRNWLPTERAWESLLAALPWEPSRCETRGRFWYGYYPIYTARREASFAAP